MDQQINCHNILNLKLIDSTTRKEIIEESFPTIPYINCTGHKDTIKKFLKEENLNYFQQILCRTQRIAFLTNSNELHYFNNENHFLLQKPKNLKIYYMSASYGHLMLLVDRITIINNETKEFNIEKNNDLYYHQLPNGELIKVPRLFSVIAFDEVDTNSVYGENKIDLLNLKNCKEIKNIYLLKDIEEVVANNEFITYMACAAKTSVFVTNFGRLYVYGANYFGDVGMGAGIDDISKITLHKIFNERTDIYFVKVTSGDHNIIALTNDGRVFVCGYNSGNRCYWTSQYYAVIYLTKSGKLFTTNNRNGGVKTLVNVSGGFMPRLIGYNMEFKEKVLIDNVEGYDLMCSGGYSVYAVYWTTGNEIVCDGAPDVSGQHDIDEYVQLQLILAALNITTHVLDEGGVFVSKIFRGKDISLLYAQCAVFFEKVYCAKPKSSRNSSLESFVVCKGFHLPKDYIPRMIDPLLDYQYSENKNELLLDTSDKVTITNNNDSVTVNTITSLSKNMNQIGKANAMVGNDRFIVPFLACGDLSGFDSDRTYALDNNEKSLLPVQPPTRPPYKKAVDMKRRNYLSKSSDMKRENCLL
ncbi:hypothetical protein ABK040_005975 [Willaertia magna]